MGTVCVSVVAMQDFYTVDRLLTTSSNEAFTGMVEDVGREDSRNFLRYLASELNRLFFRLWNLAQFGIGGTVLWLLWRVPQASRLRGLVIGMLAVVVFLTVWVTPEIIAIGSSLDFVPRDPAPSALSRFGMLHATYTILELLKCAVGIAAAVWVGRLGRVQPVASRKVTSVVGPTPPHEDRQQAGVD